MEALIPLFSRKQRSRSWWVLCPFLLLYFHFSAFDGVVLLCLTSRSGEDKPQALDKVPTFSGDPTRTQGQSAGEEVADSLSFSSPSTSQPLYDPSDGNDSGGAALWSSFFSEEQTNAQRNKYTNEFLVSRSSSPRIAIPVCMKPHIDILLEHAFNLLIYRQQQYLLRESRSITKKAKPEKSSSYAEQNGGQETENTFTLKQRNLPKEQEAVKSEVETAAQSERVRDSIVGGVLCALLGKPCHTLNLLPPSLWRETSGRVNAEENDSDKILSPPSSPSSLGPGLRSQYTWSRAYSRLLERMMLAIKEDFVLDDDAREQELFRLRRLLRYRFLLDSSWQLNDLGSRLQSFGLLALPNQPENAALYLSLLTSDEEGMTLWRQHLLRHVWQSKFLVSPCDRESVAAGAAEADLLAAGPASTAERMERRAGEEDAAAWRKEEQGFEEEEEEEEEAGNEATVRDYAGFASFLGARDVLRREAATERRGKGEEEEGDFGEEKKPREHIDQGDDPFSTFKFLLVSEWEYVYDMLLMGLQEEFWMSRPASSAAAVQMIAVASQKQQQHEVERMIHSLQKKIEEEEEKKDEIKELLLQPERPEEETQGEDRREEKRSESSSGRGSDSSEERKAARETMWKAEVSLRFRYVSMKDAQKMMGTFLTSNLHPEMNFPTGRKLPPQPTSTSSRSGSGEGQEGNEEEDEGGNAEKGRAEEDERLERNAGGKEAPIREGEGGGELPEKFDAREAFPACKEVIGHVRDQGSCGSCWAFSSTTSFNDRLCIKSGGKLKTLLSPQHTTSCCDATRCASFGCNGGEIGLAWRWFTDQGVVSGGDYDTLRKGETCWPYEIPFCSHAAAGPFPKCEEEAGEDDTPLCRSDCEEEAYTENVQPFEKDLHRASSSFSYSTPAQAKRDILRSGSISAAFMVYEDFLNYKGGVYKHVYGMPLGGHAAKVIGWGVEKGEDYWLIVNSWNTYWGADGLFKIKIGDSGINDDLLAGDAAWSPRKGEEREKELEASATVSPDETSAQRSIYKEL